MGANESARQVGSTDTNLDHQLDHDLFAVGILKFERSLNQITFIRIEKSEMNLTEDLLEEFDEAFNFFDSDRDGLINENELGKVS